MPEVIVSIYNHKYRLAVSTGGGPPSRLAAQIDRQMEAMKASGKVIAADQIAVLTALRSRLRSEEGRRSRQDGCRRTGGEERTRSAREAAGQSAARALATEPAHTDEDLEHVRRLCRLCEDAIFRDTKIGALF